MAVLLAAPQQTHTIKWASEMQRAAFTHGPSVYGVAPEVTSGGFGAGKTWAYCLKALWLSDAFPKNRGVIARRVGKELRATTMATFFKVCHPSAYDQTRGGRRNDQEGYVRLADSGSEILFMHFEDPATQAILRGLELNWFLIDQAEEDAEHMEPIFDILLGRLSRWDVAEVPESMIAAAQASGQDWPYRNPETKKAIPPPYAMLACNPDSELHWIYRRFHPESPEHTERRIPVLDTTTGLPTGAPPRSYHDLGYRMYHMPSLENRFLTEAYRQGLLNQDESFIRRYVRGEWGFPEGAIHTVHPSSLIPSTPELVEWIKRTCALFRTMDYGDSAPTCVIWWGVDRNGNCIAWQEYYLPNAMISTHRGNIAGLSHPSDRYEMNLADPSIFHQMPAKQGGRFCVADEYADVISLPRHTAVFWSPADNNELGTRNRINEYLRFDPERINPFTKEPGSSRLFFLQRNEESPNGIVHALQQVRSQRRLKIGTDGGKPVFSDERDETITDHAYDCVRYFIASRPPAPREPVPAQQGTFLGARRLMVKARQSSRIR